MITIGYHFGTLEIRGLEQNSSILPLPCRWDERSLCFRAPAIHYAEVILSLVKQKLEYQDQARAYEELHVSSQLERTPHPYQAEAITAWKKAMGRGVVVLPTGAGKTHVATMALLDKKRSTLVIAPTLELVRQWYELLKTTLGIEVGLLGGGEYDIQSITVSTYDSAYLHMEHIGNRFGLLVFDECHHLPSESYALAAQFCLAPYRLGLTATPERADGQEQRLVQLIGPLVYRRDIRELSGSYLSNYGTMRVVVKLSEEERKLYEENRAIYRDFLRSHDINMADPKGWAKFILFSSRSREGQKAFEAYRKQRDIALASAAKLDHVNHLLYQHRHDRVLLFTQDNATAYEVSRRFLIPVITHQTKVKERSEILTFFKEGKYNALVTSKVLNEGVDVPDANVAIIISGNGSIREHVQRLGRILRKKEGKQAILYELVSENTSETYTSKRRREHAAYQ